MNKCEGNHSENVFRYFIVKEKTHTYKEKQKSNTKKHKSIKDAVRDITHYYTHVKLTQ